MALAQEGIWNQLPDEFFKSLLLFAQSSEVALLLGGPSVDKKVNPAKKTQQGQTGVKK